MKRRSFLKGAALAGLGALVAPELAARGVSRQVPKADASPAADFRFRPDGSFKLMQITDTHHIKGDVRSVRAMACVCDALDAEHPDLVIHTGDIIFGRPDIDSALEILQPLVDRKIPFAVALGNHDSQFGAKRDEMYQAIRNLPGCVNTAPKEGVYGCSNDLITLSGDAGPERALYLFDSMDAVVLKGEEEIHCYDYIRHSQIGWYRDWSMRLTKANGGNPVPSLAFMHIPLCEVAEGLASERHTLVGNNCEPPCPSRLNSGLAAQFRELGDVQAAVFGHDHDCDYVMNYSGLHYIYGRYSGGDTIYNHLGAEGASESRKVSGVRVFGFLKGDPGFITYIRLYGGDRQFPVRIG